VADLVLDELGFEGDHKIRLLDPACGSGTFLVSAIGRVRRGFDQQPEMYARAEKGLLDAMLRNIVGFDINPLAVLASRTNFLIAIRDLLKFGGEIELPVFLADSVSTPTEYENLFTGASPVARVPCAATKPPFLLAPREVGASVATVNAFTQTIEHALKVGLDGEEFLTELAQSGFQMRDRTLYRDLYNTMAALKDEGRDGIWARIIKNSFAPLFVGKFDLVVGNPPWVNWEALAPEYRRVSAEAWGYYRLIGRLPGRRRQASAASKTDVCVLMTYVAADKYLTDRGRLGFVLPRTIFQSETGGWHFRRFELPSGAPICVELLHDIDAMKPFRGQATNSSCVVVVRRGRKTTYPVRWRRWRPSRARMQFGASLHEVRAAARLTTLYAEPIEARLLQSPWIVGTKATLGILRSTMGRSPYAPLVREGLNTRGANGIYFLDAEMKNSRIMVTNHARAGRSKRVHVDARALEADHLYPLLRGEDVSPYMAMPRSYVLVPHASDDPVDAIQFSHLPRSTREYLSEFKKVLSSRKKFRNFDPTGPRWYGLYSVLGATFSRHKVVWREIASGSGIIAAAISVANLPNGSGKVIMPDHKLTIVPCQTETEADFVAGFLNSDVANLIVRSYALATGISTHILDRVPVPKFSISNPLHTELARLAAGLRTSGNVQGQSAKTARISAIAAQLAGLSKEQATKVGKELARL